ncbi:hypothetical protein [Nocardia sp. NPDC057440]|uniref:hypothetical protein n=1 Tax=Nocardia sp. NPDC057440 TaxID=3346134 RepID=UPI00366CE1F2
MRRLHEPERSDCWAAAYEATGWPQIMLFYERLLGLVDNPMIALDHAVAVAMAPRPARRVGAGRRARHR